jgi:hypothetical protein
MQMTVRISDEGVIHGFPDKARRGDIVTLQERKRQSCGLSAVIQQFQIRPGPAGDHRHDIDDRVPQPVKCSLSSTPVQCPLPDPQSALMVKANTCSDICHYDGAVSDGAGNFASRAPTALATKLGTSKLQQFQRMPFGIVEFYGNYAAIARWEQDGSAGRDRPPPAGQHTFPCVGDVIGSYSEVLKVGIVGGDRPQRRSSADFELVDFDPHPI